jgi:rubrerythrin
VSELVSVVASAASRATALAKGPLHAIRGTSEQEKMLKNAKTEYWNEFEEIANYNAIETLAESVGDKETAKMARAIRREEERMAKFLEKQIPTLTKAVAQQEIPASERRTSGGRRRSSRRRTSQSRKGGRSTTKRSTTKRSTSKRSTSKRRTSQSRSGSSSGSRGRRSGGRQSGGRRSGGSSRR